ncbi:MAG: TolC family protein [Acidobacteriota bacterium]|nr:TolC family protein [Acidobacteriota bacterium]
MSLPIHPQRFQALRRKGSASSILVAMLLLPVLVLVLPLASAHAQEETSAQEAPPTGETPLQPRWQPVSGSPEGLELGLEDAVRRALESNEAVLLARAEQARLGGELRQVTSQALPQLSADADYVYNIEKPVLFLDTEGGGVQRITIGSDYDIDAGVTLSQKVLDLRYAPARRSAQLDISSARASLEDAETAVALAARRAYYQALLARELQTVQTQALEQARQRLTQVQEFFDAGTAAEFDLLTAQVEVDNIRPELIQAENDLALALEELRRITGIPAGTPLELVDGFSETLPPIPAIDAAVAEALGQRADLEAQRLRAEAAEARTVAAERSNFPTLDFESAYRRNASTTDAFPGDNEFTNSWNATLSLTWPLFESGARAGRVVAAEARRDTEQLLLQQLTEDARLEVRQAVLALRAANQSVEASQSNVRRAERALEIAGVRYRNGLSTQVELNDAELAVTRARSNYAQALYSAAVARAELVAAQGGGVVVNAAAEDADSSAR